MRILCHNVIHVKHNDTFIYFLNIVIAFILQGKNAVLKYIFTCHSLNGSMLHMNTTM